MKVFYNADVKQLLSKAAGILNKYFVQKKSVLFLSSGGSALNILSLLDSSALGPHITIGVLDERYSFDATINSFAQIRDNPFYTLAKNKGCLFFDSRPKDTETLEQLAFRFDQFLQTWRKNNPEGVIIITQGIGPDSHTSGIFPYPGDSQTFKQLFDDKEKWVIGYDVGKKNKYPHRVTTTVAFLKDQVDISIFYATGRDKKEALLHALTQRSKVHEVPAAVIHQMKDVRVLTDILLT